MSRQRLSRRELLALAAVPAVGLVGWGVRRVTMHRSSSAVAALEVDRPIVPIPDTPEVRQFRRFARDLAPLFSRVPPPGPRDWLATYAELGQTFDQFLVDVRQRHCDRYRKIYLLRLGDLSERQIELTADAADFMERFFGFPIAFLDPLPIDPLPDDAQRVRESGMLQMRTTYAMDDLLAPWCPDDAVAVVALTARDLWDGGFGYLFGHAAPSQRVCIGSFARLGDVDAGEVDYATCLRRVCGLVAHETGHVLGMPHCVAWQCRMNGSNHIAESDRRPLEFCPECLPKIWWTCGLTPRERFARLAEFSATHRLPAEAAFWRRAGKVVGE